MEGDILANPKIRGIVAPTYKAIDTPISHIAPPLSSDVANNFKFKKIKKKSKKL